jgi:hypothetical protein
MTDDDTPADLESPEQSLVGETDRRSYLGALMLAPLSGAGATTAATAATPSEVHAAVQQTTANTYGEGGYGDGTYGGTDVPQYVLDYLDDTSNIVETSGLQTAIDDLRNDTLTAAQLRVVMSYWAAGTVVT